MRIFVSALMAFVIGITSVSAYSYDEREISNIYTTTKVRLPPLCRNSNIAPYCNNVVLYFSNLFEHNFISFIAGDLGSEAFFDPDNYGTAVQEIELQIRPINDLNFVSYIARVHQSYQDHSFSYVRIFNYTVDTGARISFEDIFDDPSLAASICAERVREFFSRYDRKKLSMVCAQIEVLPYNFVILPNGLEFIFFPGELAPMEVVPHVMISLEELYEAGPKLKWFPQLTKEQMDILKNDDPISHLDDGQNGSQREDSSKITDKE